MEDMKIVIPDVYNVNGRHLNEREKEYVITQRCLNLGLTLINIELQNTIGKSIITFGCTTCGKQANRKFQSVYQYETTNCKDCANKNKMGRFKRKEMSRSILQEVINKNYIEKDFSFTVIEDFTYKNNMQQVLVKCTRCDREEKSKILLLTQGTKSCPCDSQRSSLEDKVVKILTDRHLKYFREKSFPDLRLKLPLRYDFYIEHDNKRFLIECDGIQHFYPTFGQKSFDATTISDHMKTDYARIKEIPLLRIPYNVKENIESLIVDFLNQ